MPYRTIHVVTCTTIINTDTLFLEEEAPESPVGFQVLGTFTDADAALEFVHNRLNGMGIYEATTEDDEDSTGVYWDGVADDDDEDPIVQVISLRRDRLLFKICLHLLDFFAERPALMTL
ncbi:hypothetical protein MMC12_003049 [Toensbergia leucococca]|nr:hypothetical protein [Toensbergia leucococca]